MNPTVILLLCIISYVKADAIASLDDPKFATLGKHFAGTPSLLVSLAAKEEVVRMILSNFCQELREASINETMLGAVSYNCDDQLDLVERYLKDYDETSGIVSSEYTKQKTQLRPQHVTWNPLATYHMIRRFSIDLKELLQSLNLADTVHRKRFGLLRNLQRHHGAYMKGFGWPSEEDLKNQISAILRIQHVYDLNSSELAIGKIHDRVTNVELRGSDCIAIGKHAMATNYYALAIEWLEVAVQKLKVESNPMMQMAQNELENAIMVHDRLWEKNEGWEPLHYAHKVSEQNHDRFKRHKAEFDTFKGNKTFDLHDIAFWGLCRGENYQKPEEKKKLFCYYESKISNNAWAIRPVKAEILSLNPLIVQYYDVIGDKMIERIEQEAEPWLARSVVFYDDTVGGYKLSGNRTSTNTWIDDHSKQPFNSIPKRIGAITGMNVNGDSAAEILQVASYATGGHYGIHSDYFLNSANADEKGNRIATFMFYLSDVEKGGSTAFPLAGIAVTPVKGSAVYWYNLLSSGDPDQQTWHGACPVILGEKWVANKFIRAYEQMHGIKCHPAGQVPIRFEVNGKPLSFDEYDEAQLNAA